MSGGQYFHCHICGALTWRNEAQIRRSKTGVFFCGDKCRKEWKAPSIGSSNGNWKGGKASYRRLGLTTYGYQCRSGESCPLKAISLPPFLYEVDHVDSNRKNNTVENLQVLCVWCHKLKTMGVELLS